MLLPLKVESRAGIFPLVTLGLTSANGLIFFFMISMPDGGESFTWLFATVARAVTTFEPVHPDSTLFPPLTLISSQFLHADILHLLFNMIFLWVFGAHIEAKLGKINFLIFYLACGILSGITQIVTAPSSTVPMIGASGAIAGVMGAFFLRFPGSRVNTLLIIVFVVKQVRLPAIVFLGIWLLIEIVMGAPKLGTDSAGVAHFAHIGGFLWGMILYKLFEKK